MHGEMALREEVLKHVQRGEGDDPHHQHTHITLAHVRILPQEPKGALL
jgi:hypothetical protein